MGKFNANRWASIVTECRGTLSRDKLAKKAGLSQSTIVKWEKGLSKPTKSAVEALILSCPQVEANRIYHAAGLPIIITNTGENSSEHRLGQILYKHLVNSGLESYGEVVSPENIDIYDEMLELFFKSLNTTKKIK